MTDHIPDAGKKLVEAVARAAGLDIDIAPGHARCLDCLEERADKIRQSERIIRAIEAAGYRIVPEEPTEEMLKKGVHAFQHSYASEDTLADWRANYRAMLAAAPKVVP
jgi:hypothetical protein